MADVVLKNVCKIYPSRDKRHPEGVMAVKDFNIDISDNEFIVFVGPSGCGKSTTLRMIAGLEDISSGELYIDGQYMNNVEPKNRDISMVFQNYALYPHMTAYENIAFGLTLRKVAEPVYEENETTEKLLNEIAEIEAQNKTVFLQMQADDKSTVKCGEFLAKLTKRLQDTDETIEEFSARKVKSVAMQNKLISLNEKRTALDGTISSMRAELERLKSQTEKSLAMLDENEVKVKAIRNELLQYQKKAIDEKLIAEQTANIAYYDKLVRKDADRKVSDEQSLDEKKKAVEELDVALADSKYSNTSDKAIQSELYKLQLKREQLLEDIEFLRNELEILEKRKITLEKFIAESREKLNYYKNNEQPVFKYRKYTKMEIDRKVKMASDILGIGELLQRKPREMSGGQRQRIALGRAIVREPKVFLLDEPLSNLDAKLRATMRVEISRLHERLKTTFIYVTHDQIEAMTMGTRIVVMKGGIIQQIDTPTNLFDFPDNVFVAGFIGTPQMNFFDVTLKTTAEQVHITFADGYTVKYSKAKMRKIKPEYDDGKEHSCVLGIRGENVTLAETGLNATISDMEILGSETHLHLACESAVKEVIVKLTQRSFTENESVKLAFDESKIHLFDKVSEETVLERNA